MAGEKGSIAIGILVGIILVALLAVMPVAGGLEALDGSLGLLIIGIVVGAIARSAGRGLVAAIVAGLAGAILLSIVFFATSGFYASSPLAMINGMGLSTSSAIRSTVIGIALVALGGLIGGALVPAEIVEEKSEMVYTRNKDKVDDEKEEETEEESDNYDKDTSLDILKRRYANGEITKKQYSEMKKDLDKE